MTRDPRPPIRNPGPPPPARDRGTAATEMAILLPLYILLAFGFLFFGFRAILQARIQPALRYALSKPDVQAQSDVEPFLRDLREENYQGEGRVTDFAETLDETALPSESSITGALVEETYDPVGRYVLNPSTMQIEFKMDPDRLAPLGRFILRNNLTAVAPDAASASEGWLARSRVNLAYRSSVFDVKERLELENTDLRPESGSSIVRGQKARGPHASSTGEEAVRSVFGMTPPAPRDDTAPFFRKN